MIQSLSNSENVDTVTFVPAWTYNERHGSMVHSCQSIGKTSCTAHITSST